MWMKKARREGLNAEKVLLSVGVRLPLFLWLLVPSFLSLVTEKHIKF